MTSPKEPKLTQTVPLEPIYAKISDVIPSPNNLISPLNSKHPLENLTTVDPNSLSNIQKPKHPEWNTMKVPKKNAILDIKPFKRARSLSERQKEKEDPPKPKQEEIPRTKFYLKKFTNFFKRGPATEKKDELIVLGPKKRNSMRSMTTNKVYPEAKLDNDQQLETVNENDDKYDIDLFDQELLLESPSKLQNDEEAKMMYQRLQHMIQAEEEEYVYQNAHDSEEDNENNDKKFKLLDPALVYERELARLSNAEPFYSLFTQKKNAFEMNDMYSDSYPLLELRKKLMFIKCSISHLCFLIVTSKIFEGGSLLIIVWNTAMMMVDPNSTMDTSATFDQMFLIIYTIEMGLKIFAFGFILAEKSYLRDYWNLLDFTIISTGYIPYVVTSSNSINLSALRSLRVLRPLRSISKIKSLKTILVTLFSAMPLIMSSVMVNLFFLLIFAIAGLQLFSGMLKRRCFDAFTGLLLTQDPNSRDPIVKGVMCGLYDCPGSYICGKITSNPNQDIINFDTIFYSFLMIFQSITLEGWTQIMNYVIRCWSYYAVFFFIVLVWIGAYFLVNLTLAVISMKFKEADTKTKNVENDEDDEEDEKITGPSVIDIRNLKLCEKSHHKRAIRRLNQLKSYGANEEIFKKEKDEIRWDDLFELKERIREERERLDAEEEFMKIRDQELEGSSYKRKRSPKKHCMKYMPKYKTNNNNKVFTQKIVHNSKKLKIVGIQGVNHSKTPEKMRPEKTSPELGKKSISPTKRKTVKQNLEILPEKTDEETMQLINLNEDELFLQEATKKALTFKEVRVDHNNISTLLRKPKVFKKDPENDEIGHILAEELEEANSGSKLLKDRKPDEFHRMITPKTDEKIQSLRESHLAIQRKSTVEIAGFNSSFKKKRQSLQVGADQLISGNKFRESRRKTVSKPEGGLNFLKKQGSRRLKRGLTKLSSFSGGEGDGSNLASTILNDSDFNIAGFEKPEKNKSLVIIPMEIESGSPFTRANNILHPTRGIETKIFEEDPQNTSHNNTDQLMSFKILPKELTSSNNQLTVPELSKPSGGIGNVAANKFLSGLKLKNVVKEAIKEKKMENKTEMLASIEQNSNLKEDHSNDANPQDFSMNLAMKPPNTDPSPPNNTDTITEKEVNVNPKPKEKKILRNIVGNLTQTDPENNNVEDTDLENGGVVKNYSEQASTRTFIESKNTIDQKDKKWGFLKRTLTNFKRKPTEKKKKEELERLKRLMIQKKFNVLHYKLMITGKEYESNSMDDVWASRIENLQKQKEIAFEKEVHGRKEMPIEYLSKQINIKKIEKERKREERRIFLELERKRQDSIDFQTLMNTDTLKKILKISKNYKRLPLNLHRNLVTLMLKQRNALYGDRSSRSKFGSKVQSKITSSLLSPASKTNLTNQSMNFSTKQKNVKKKKKKPSIKIVYDYENLKEACKEKLYDKEQIIEQLKEFDQEDVYKDIWLSDFKAGIKLDFHRNIKVSLRWSGEDLIDFQNFYYKRALTANHNEPLTLFKMGKFQSRVNRLVNSISSKSYDKDVWLVGLKGKVLTVHKYLKKLVFSNLFEHTMLLAVVINTVILAMDGLFYDQKTNAIFDEFNLVLSMTFTVEMAMKILAETPKQYVSDKMNVFDGCVVIISQVELWALSGTKGLSAFRTVRIFRTFRVLRVTRLLRSLEFMKIIINVIARCVDSLIYIGLLLLLFNVIYALIGIQIYSGNLDNSIGIRQNFNDFQSAFAATFQLMTVENWNDILTITLNSSVGASITCLYLISWIFIGNYVFLNLILAILLEAFAEEWKEKLEGKFIDFEDYEQKEHERKLKEMQEKEQEARIQAMEIEELESELLNKTRKKHEKALFQGVVCQNSLFLFPKTGLFRQTCYRIVHSTIFENFILFLIILSSMKLAIDTYLPADNAEVTVISSDIDNAFNSAFFLECGLKLIALGFAIDEGSYLRDNWNILDFIIVCSSLIDMAVESINLPFIKILRLLRTLRPLRFISHNLNMKIVVTALLESAGPIANVTIVVMLIFLMFSIFGMSMLQDRFGYCYYNYGSGNPYHITQDDCVQNYNGVWQNREDNFDNIFRAMMTIFIISTQENWPNAMFDGMDSNTSDIGPAFNSMQVISYFYMIALFITNIILINLFVGVIFMNFIEATNNTNPYHSILLTPEQERWLDFQKMISSAKSDFNSFLLPSNKYRKKVYELITYRYFDLFIMVCIVSNIITMALTYEGSPSSYDKILEDINYFFTAVFILESLLKIIGMGSRAYWYSGWNKFDLFVVSTSLLDIIMSNIGGGSVSFLRVGPQLARVFRVLRVSRLLKLVKSLKGIQKLLETLMIALPALMNVGALLLLVFFVFSVLGVFLFQDIKNGVIIDDLNNFENFHHAMVTLFRCSTGESWWVFMFDCFKSTPYAPIFWITFMVIGSFIMMNLFILVIIDEFEKYSSKGDSPSTVFKESIIEFRKNWSALTRNTQGMKMPARILIDFFKMLQPELGFGKEARREMVAKEIMKMNIVGDDNNNVYFNEVLYGALKRTFGDLEVTTDIVEHKRVKIRRKVNPITQKMITESELQTKRRIDKLKIDLIKRELRRNRSLARSSTKKSSNSIKQNSLFKSIEMKSSNSLLDDSKSQVQNSKVMASSKKKVYLNPLVTILFVGMTFKSWINFMKKVKTGLMQNDFNFEEGSDDSDEEEYLSEKSESFLEEDLFNDEEQKEYEEKAHKPKVPKKNLLEYDKADDENEEEEEEEEEDSVDLPNPQPESKKPILRNNRMSAFAVLEKKSIPDTKKDLGKRFSLKPDMLKRPSGKVEQLISEERDDVVDSEESG